MKMAAPKLPRTTITNTAWQRVSRAILAQVGKMWQELSNDERETWSSLYCGFLTAYRAFSSRAFGVQAQGISYDPSASPPIRYSPVVGQYPVASAPLYGHPWWCFDASVDIGDEGEEITLCFRFLDVSPIGEGSLQVLVSATDVTSAGVGFVKPGTQRTVWAGSVPVGSDTHFVLRLPIAYHLSAYPWARYEVGSVIFFTAAAWTTPDFKRYVLSETARATIQERGWPQDSLRYTVYVGCSKDVWGFGEIDVSVEVEVFPVSGLQGSVWAESDAGVEPETGVLSLLNAHSGPEYSAPLFVYRLEAGGEVSADVKDTATVDLFTGPEYSAPLFVYRLEAGGETAVEQKDVITLDLEVG